MHRYSNIDYYDKICMCLSYFLWHHASWDEGQILAHVAWIICISNLHESHFAVLAGLCTLAYTPGSLFTFPSMVIKSPTISFTSSYASLTCLCLILARTSVAYTESLRSGSASFPFIAYQNIFVGFPEMFHSRCTSGLACLMAEIQQDISPQLWCLP